MKKMPLSSEKLRTLVTLQSEYAPFIVEDFVMTLPFAENRTLEFDGGQAIGTSYQWSGGQYCAIHTAKGLVGCGIYDIRAANEFSLVVAIARGTPAKPLRVPEDLFNAKILEVSQAAEKLGVVPGMTGREAVEKMLAAK
jgi:uncharacterized protein YunC (DUF1805 family)